MTSAFGNIYKKLAQLSDYQTYSLRISNIFRTFIVETQRVRANYAKAKIYDKSLNKRSQKAKVNNFKRSMFCTDYKTCTDIAKRKRLDSMQLFECRTG